MLACVPASVRAQTMSTPMADADTRLNANVSSAMGGSLMEMPHMRMTRLEPRAPGDSARGAAIIGALQRSLAPYTDYHRALADGFRIFAPKVKQPVYHFTSWRRSLLSRFRFDPAEPSTLLYERTGDSTFRLVGAMYIAPRHANLHELNERVPLSLAQWHRHTNWCIPRTRDASRWTAGGPDGRPLFGAQGSITTEAACTAAGGRFFPEVLGWMVHVYPFAADTAAVWGRGPDAGRHGHEM